MLKIIAIGSFLFGLNYCASAQFNQRYQDISKKDIIEALQFAGVNIFSFEVDSHKSDCRLIIALDEYDSTNGLRRIDTLLDHETEYRRYSTAAKYRNTFVKQLKIFAKVLNDRYDSVFLYIETENVGTWQTLHITREFARKHYWVRFKDQHTVLGKSIPLLFFGSEWTEVINGIVTPRFCTSRELDPAMSDPVIKHVPHYFIISYELTKTREGK